VSRRNHACSSIELRTLSQLALVAILALAGCSKGRTPEELTSRRIDVMQELATILAEVTDKESALAHEQSVADIIDAMNTLRRHFNWLTKGEKRAIQTAASERAPEIQAALDKMKLELTRVRASTDIQSVLGPVLDRL
jgi:hypothetical protein